MKTGQGIKCTNTATINAVYMFPNPKNVTAHNAPVATKYVTKSPSGTFRWSLSDRFAANIDTSKKLPKIGIRWPRTDSPASDTHSVACAGTIIGCRLNARAHRRAEQREARPSAARC